MSKVIMIQGTMSNAGKSLLVGGLCRVFRQDGYRVAPFKSQNMALNSFVTKDGLEMGRAQVMQAECAKIEPSVHMNPILLKPTNDIGSQVIVNGEVRGDMPAREYFEYKKALVPDILEAFEKLSRDNDIIVIEGAGSPAEINLMENDIVNMGMAEMVDAPVLLVGDIDRGGVFAQLYGTVKLLDESRQHRIKGMIINKFRGDVTLLDSGIEMLEKMTGIPVMGTVPYRPLDIDDEDSLSTRLQGTAPGLVNIGVIRFPRISNFTDLAPFEQIPGVGLRYITKPSQLQDIDLLILPGTKNTIGDLRWLRRTGLEGPIREFAKTSPVIGICGGYQMLGEWIHDPNGVEEGGSEEGLRLLPVETVLEEAKHREQVQGYMTRDGRTWAYQGYEIHAGNTSVRGGEVFTWRPENKSQEDISQENINGIRQGNIYGTYVHGIFDEGSIARDIVQELATKKQVKLPPADAKTFRQIREEEYDKLADLVRENLDMDRIYEILEESEGKDALGNAKDNAPGNAPEPHFEHVLPGDIEKRSFQIIGEELQARGIQIPEEEDPVTRRVIHTTADFEYAETMMYSQDALQIADQILRAGGDIVTDTNMTRAGINKKFLGSLGGQVHCYMADPDVAKEAKERGVTRATVSMERAAELPGPVIVSVGNAPTALISLYEIMQKSSWRPGLIIGVPVGFVNVEPAKELILKSGVPYIVNRGRKGGSNVAAAICNALLYRIRDGKTAVQSLENSAEKPQGKSELRKGFTTGSCSAAAAKAATYMLFTGAAKESIAITTPGGPIFHADLVDIRRGDGWVECTVIKDGGDDPDVTTGAHICAKVEILPSGCMDRRNPEAEPHDAGICEEQRDYTGTHTRTHRTSPAQENEMQKSARVIIDGGAGVGRVTLPGLDQPVGNAAINRVPRGMIEKEVLEVAELMDFHGTLQVTISVPEGQELAQKTFNPRLGIQGGISIIGTTGIVEPMSTKAILDTIRVELSQRKAMGNSCVAVAPGNYGIHFMQEEYGYDLDASVKCSNYIGDTIDMAKELGFSGLLLTGHIGKLIKVSGGIMNTHSREGDSRMELLAAALLRAGGSAELALRVQDCLVTEEALQLIQDSSEDLLHGTMEQMMERICFYLRKRVGENLEIECIVYSMEFGLLGASKGAEEMLRKLQE